MKKIYNNLSIENLTKTEWFNQFDEGQKWLIREGLKKNLDVSIYAKIDFNSSQMIFLLNSLEKNEDVSKYADPKFTAEQMEQYSLALKENIDISKYLNFDGKQIEQIRLGLIEELDIEKYVNLNYNFAQMKQIRLGLKEGLDISNYAKIGFNGLQIKEIRLGILKEIEISKYAKKDLSWNEMRKIRIDLTKEKELSTFSLIKRKLKKTLDNLKNKKETLTLEEALELYSLEFEENEEDKFQKDFLILLKTNIEFDIKKGWDVSCYINSEFDFWQTVAIRRGLEAGVDVSKYAFVELSGEKMYKHRTSLINEKISNKNKKND